MNSKNKTKDLFFNTYFRFFGVISDVLREQIMASDFLFLQQQVSSGELHNFYSKYL